MDKITAVIPTLSNKAGLAHLLAELKEAGIKAIVIDNSKKNLGFAAAVNKGVEQAETEWVLIANDDIEEVTGEKMEQMLNVADANNWVAVSPILKSPKGVIENIGYRVLPIGRAVLNFDKSSNSDKHLDGLTMASLLIKKDVYQKIGGLDESFIAYLEDVDFFLRLKKAGYHFGVDTDVEVIHNHMTTSKKMPGFKQKRDFVNWIKVIHKNWDKKTLQKYWLAIMIERLRNLWGWAKINLLVGVDMNIFNIFINKKKSGNKIIQKIHPNDEMYLFLTTHPSLKDRPREAYFESGAEMLQKLRKIMSDMNVELSEVESFLEFACGYGRFTRYLITELDRSKITVSDIYKDAVDFQKRIFKVKGFYSTHKPEDLNIPEKYHVIFVASLFSHLPEESWGKWLIKLYDSLKKNGLLIFSVHGPKCMSDPKQMPEKGFCYMKMSESKTLPLTEYGTSYVTRFYVNSFVKKITKKNPVKFYDQYLWNYQDVYVIKKR